jgi:CHAT domain-containing protein
MPLDDEQSIRFAEIILPKPVLEEIRRRQPRVLTVAPDGVLHRLPLEALLLDAGQPESTLTASQDAGDAHKKSGGSQPRSPRYLLDDPQIPPIAYAPSAMVMAALVPDRSATVAWPPAVLTVGNPDYSQSSLPTLKQTAAECQRWKAAFSEGGNGHVELLVDRGATESQVRKHVAGKRLVHFAVHGLVDKDDDSVFASALALTPGSSVKQTPINEASDRGPDLLPDDGSLFQAEVYDLPLAGCEMAVISACESNLGKPRKLEVGSTLTRAFLSAGSRRVVSSLWQVDDEATAVMMDGFAGAVAEAMRKGERPNYAEALQQARRRVRENKEREWQNPYYWAPFVLIGPPT